MSDREMFQEPYQFSLVRGGPLFQLFRRTYLSGDELELLHRPYHRAPADRVAHRSWIYVITGRACIKWCNSSIPPRRRDPCPLFCIALPGCSLPPN